MKCKIIIWIIIINIRSKYVILIFWFFFIWLDFLEKKIIKYVFRKINYYNNLKIIYDYLLLEGNKFVVLSYGCWLF